MTPPKRDIRGEMWRWAVLHNIAIFAAIAVCTASVAYWAESPNGLWSLLLMFGMAGPSDIQKASPKDSP